MAAATTAVAEAVSEKASSDDDKAKATEEVATRKKAVDDMVEAIRVASAPAADAPAGSRSKFMRPSERRAQLEARDGQQGGGGGGGG